VVGLARGGVDCGYKQWLANPEQEPWPNEEKTGAIEILARAAGYDDGEWIIYFR
jgi:hypothetical protein